MEHKLSNHERSSSKELPDNFPLIVFVGPMGSGKDTGSDILKRHYNYSKFSASQIIREYADENGFPRENRNQMWALRQGLADTYGENVLSAKLLEKITRLYNTDSDLHGACIEGVRFLADAKTYRTRSGSMLIGLDADPVIRFARLMLRNREGDIKSRAEFDEREQIENAEIPSIYPLCDIILSNEGIEEELETQILEFMQSVIALP